MQAVCYTCTRLSGGPWPVQFSYLRDAMANLEPVAAPFKGADAPRHANPTRTNVSELSPQTASKGRCSIQLNYVRTKITNLMDGLWSPSAIASPTATSLLQMCKCGCQRLSERSALSAS